MRPPLRGDWEDLTCIAMVHEFHTTQWTTVLTAAHGDTSRRHEALGRLAEKYWYPLYLYARRRGWSHDDAADATQDFFARILEKELLRSVNPEKGRFRTFLLVCLRNFLAGRREHERAQKRGGGQVVFSLNAAEAGQRFGNEPAVDETPESSYHRSWALALLECVLARLREEYGRANKELQFDQLGDYLTGDPAALPYAAVAAQLGMSAGAVRTAVHRLRKRYAELLREEISQTVASAEDVDQEIHDLFRAVAS
jgi:RNA polymerase sigma-70 factor (ECF subfamily)